MELNRIQIENFRSIEFAEVPFEPRCRVLLGKNEVGKSNILAACALLDEATQVESSDLREARDEEDPVKEGSVNFIFRLSAEDLGKAKEKIKARVAGNIKGIVQTDAGTISLDSFVDEFREWIYIVDLPSGDRRTAFWTDDKTIVSDGWLYRKPGVSGATEIKLRNGIARSLESLPIAHKDALDPESLAHYVKASLGNIRAQIKIAIDEIVKPKLPKCVLWSYSEKNLLPQGIDIEAFKSDPRSCEPLRAMFLLAGEDDPAEAINNAQGRPNGFKNLLTRVARLTSEHVRKKWKEVGGVDIVLAPNGNQIDAAVKDRYNEYSFARRSDGFKRFVSFLILVSARSATSDLSETLFLQDEPDLGLHPSGVKSLLAEFVSLSSSNYILVTTHSIFMVDKDRIDRHLVVTKKEETSRVAEVERSTLLDEEVLFNALGYSIFELIKPTNILFEGWRDKKLFSVSMDKRGEAGKYLRERFKKDVGSTHAMGVKEISKMVGYLEAMERRSMVVTDSDQVARERQSAFSADPARHLWFRYDELIGQEGVYTAEDFIVPKRLGAAFREVLTTNGYSMQAPSPLFEPSQDGVVDAAKNYLADMGLKPEVQKDLLNRWKSKIFDSLESSHVADSYLRVMQGVADKLRQF